MAWQFFSYPIFRYVPLSKDYISGQVTRGGDPALWEHLLILHRRLEEYEEKKVGAAPAINDQILQNFLADETSLTVRGVDEDQMNVFIGNRG